MQTRSSRLGSQAVGFLREWGMILIIIAITLIATFVRPAFLSWRNIQNILRAYSTIGIASIGMAYTIIGGGMDLSIGSTISLSAVITMLIVNGTVQGDVSPVYAAFLALLAGLAVGAGGRPDYRRDNGRW